MNQNILMKEVKNLSKIVIVGAGFAGISAAISAKNNKNEIILLEKRNVVGKKILVTGNGRCNYYNDFQNDNCYHSSNDNFTKNLKDEAHIVRDFYSDLGIIPYIKDGYYYPYSKEASSIRNVLIRKCESLGIKIITSYTVNSIKKDDNKFIINDDITCDKVILATGSMAYYKDDEQLIGYDIAKSFGHNIIKCLPSLVQLKGKGNFFKKWAGVRSEVEIGLYIDDKLKCKEKGEIMLTDYGISGICVFNISGYASRAINDNSKVRVSINFVPWMKDNIYEYLNNRNEKLSDVLEGMLNAKLVSLILDECKVNSDITFKELSNSMKDKIIRYLIDFKLDIVGVNDFDKAQVSSGGVDTLEIDRNTFESKLVKGLYIIGEMVDVDGICGGYNITFATLSGIKAGSDLAK